MTDVRIGGLGREALVSDVGQVRIGGVVREALISGVGDPSGCAVWDGGATTWDGGASKWDCPAIAAAQRQYAVSVVT